MGTVVLSAKSRKAKSRLRQWGNKWDVIRSDSDKFQIIAFEDRTETHESLRWIDRFCDPDFEILEFFED